MRLFSVPSPRKSFVDPELRFSDLSNLGINLRFGPARDVSKQSRGASSMSTRNGARERCDSSSVFALHAPYQLVTEHGSRYFRQRGRDSQSPSASPANHERGARDRLFALACRAKQCYYATLASEHSFARPSCLSGFPQKTQ
jgi:hypothetical protein